jgi:hypothetical protein
MATFDLQLFKIMNWSQNALKFIIILAFSAINYCVKLYLSRTFELSLLCCSAGLTMGFESLFKVFGVSDVLSVCITLGGACTKGGYQ